LPEIDVDIVDYIGTDESGKGDYFGPLVVAAVHITPDNRDLLLGLEVRDSKKVSDNKIIRIARQIEAEVPTAVIVIGAPKYNELYAKMKNLNRLLAWAHAKAIENLLEDGPSAAVTDQFGDPRYVESIILKKRPDLQLIQETKAERYLGVAAASFLARAKFLSFMKSYSDEFGIDLLKGAGPMMDDAAARYCRKHGADALPNVAKMHFKNTSKVNGILSRNPG